MSPPPGCRLYRGAVPRALCAREEPALTSRALAAGAPIEAGHADGLRVQVDMSVKHDAAARALHDVLEREGELVGRLPREWRALHSLAGCAAQGMHFDYNPDRMEGLFLGTRMVG